MEEEGRRGGREKRKRVWIGRREMEDGRKMEIYRKRRKIGTTLRHAVR